MQKDKMYIYLKMQMEHMSMCLKSVVQGDLHGKLPLGRGPVHGKAGISGVNRQTGGGGSGAGFWQYPTIAGSNGTSFSGGCGSSMRGANNTGSSGSAYGGAGGTNPRYNYGGAGNPGGKRSL